ncbi:EF-hand domain-containing protein [Roseibium sp. Sym1]|uniref:EF-hand domain-containing protein n=1 Tax=Roseibium sp. Sym1 TaxID=3016006 RepID=UPI0022B402C9|nr:EF-hand domain-containing protein [Roseibium sp. Sym1]
MKASIMAPAVALALGVATATAMAFEGPGAHFIESWDLNGDGVVTVAEARDRRSDVFASFDANEDGFLDEKEYVLFDEARELDQAENEPQGRGRGNQNPANGMRLEVNDTNGDGKVSETEFLDNAAPWIEMIDRNGDGVVTRADFGPGRK